jgi:hypothetical protein
MIITEPRSVNNMKKVVAGIGIFAILIIFISTQTNKDIKIIKSNETIQKLDPQPKTLVTKKTIIPIKTQILSKETIEAKREIEDLKIEKNFKERKKLYMDNFKVKNQIVNIENHYIDKEKLRVQPYKEISEDDVGWPISESLHYNSLNSPINYYYTVEMMNFKDMIYGVKNGLINDFKLERSNKEDSMVYSECKVSESQYSWSLRCNNNPDGFINMHLEKGTNNITGNFNYFGNSEIINIKNGKGYIYGVYK